jgi:hypothetical protein
MALDHVVEGMVGRGLKPLRVGLGGKVRPSLKDYTLEAYLDRHPQRRELERLVSEEIKLQEKFRLLEKKIDEARNPNLLATLRAIIANANRQISVVKGRLFKLRQAMITEVLKQADVVRSPNDLHSHSC